MPTTRALWLPEALRAEGVDVRTVSGWEQRGAHSKRTGQPYDFNPVAVMNHHDAINEGIPAENVLKIMVNGRSDLPGPLCNLWLDDDSTCYVVAAGNANHAGKGSGHVLARVSQDLAPLGDARDLKLVDDIIGNEHYIGIEVNDSDGRLDDNQVDALVRINAAICRHQHWTANRCVMHREHTARKPDMAWHGPLRQLVAARLTPPAHTEDLMRTPVIVTIPKPDELGRQLVSRQRDGKMLPATSAATSSVDVKAKGNGVPNRVLVEQADYLGCLVLSFYAAGGGPAPTGDVGVVIEHRA